MPDWTSSMQRTYEYYIVDPHTWMDLTPITNIKKSRINRDSTVETRGSATIDISESLGECYIRIYMITNQNGVSDKIPLGTFLVQTPSSSFDGRIRDISMDGYTPLLELKEKQPPIGYYVPKDQNIADRAYLLSRENMRAPVVKPTLDKTLPYDFISDINDTWLSYLSELLGSVNYEYDLDEMGRVMFAPIQDIAALQPVWTFNDDNSSILYPEISMDHDLYGIPNTVEIVYFDLESKSHYYCKIKNVDSNSPISIINRGREIPYRITEPDLPGTPTEQQVRDYAERMLRSLSSIEYTVSYSHGYCPVRVGDCVLLNYERAGITDAKAKVISQTIDCTPDCPVTETAVFTKSLGGEFEWDYQKT